MAKSFKSFINEAHDYKMGDKVVHQGETHVVRKLIDDDHVGIRKARSDRFGANVLKKVHHSILKPYVPPLKPDKSGSDYGTCQICGKQHKVTHGVIAHHGYQRPGDGQQTRSCDGARCLPFEKSRDELARHIESVHNSIKHNNTQAEHLTNNDVPFSKMIKRSFRHQPELYEFKPGTPAYADEKKKQIDHHRGQSRLLADYAEYQQKRHDEWKPKQ